MKQDDKVFFRLPKEDRGSQRVLRPATVVGVDDTGCRIQLEQAADVGAASDGFLHFEERRKFLQQSVRVVAVDAGRPRVLALQIQGTPVSAESRQAYRVSCLGANIKAVIADEPGCDIVDLSVTGFAFYARSQFEVGQRVRAVIPYDGREYRGYATIQSVRLLGAKIIRYGVHSSDGAGDNLTKSLAAISLAVQSEQLRRLANS